MEPKVIGTKEEYQEALNELERLMDLQPEPGSVEWERLQLFSTLIEVYESKTYEFDTPDPIDAILFRMEEQGLKQKDLVPYIGSKSKVSEILARKRPLTLGMIRKLHEALRIPLEVLVGKEEDEAKEGWFLSGEGSEPAMCIAEGTETLMSPTKEAVEKSRLRVRRPGRS